MASVADKSARRSRPAQVLATLILGGLSAVGIAGLSWILDWLNAPSVFLVVAGIQGLFIGSILATLCLRFRFRSPILAIFLGLLCGLTVVGLVHVGHYLHYVNVEARRQIDTDPRLDQKEKDVRRQLFERSHYQYVDAILDEKTGHKGLPGFLIYRTQSGFRMFGTLWTGWAVVASWVLDALVLLAFSVILPLRAVRSPLTGTPDAGQPASDETPPSESVSESGPATEPPA